MPTLESFTSALAILVPFFGRKKTAQRPSDADVVAALTRLAAYMDVVPLVSPLNRVESSLLLFSNSQNKVLGDMDLKDYKRRVAQLKEDRALFKTLRDMGDTSVNIPENLVFPVSKRLWKSIPVTDETRGVLITQSGRLVRKVQKTKVAIDEIIHGYDNMIGDKPHQSKRPVQVHKPEAIKIALPR
jgi:hypothetical protein